MSRSGAAGSVICIQCKRKRRSKLKLAKRVLSFKDRKRLRLFGVFAKPEEHRMGMVWDQENVLV